MKNNINGTDVSECPLYDKNTCCYHTFNGECVKDSCGVYKWLLEYKRLQEENEELGKIINCKTGTIQNLAKVRDDLKQEIEELKARLKTLDDEVLTIEITPDEFERFKKYKQALEKINKWATNHNPCDIDPEVKCTKEDCFNCLNYDIKKIIRIIDEVLNDRD